MLIEIAKQAIQDGFNQTSSIDKEALLARYPELGKPKATFVTLNLNHQLRGCIGSLIAHRPLLEDLIHNAQASAFEDPRFYPLSQEEFLHVSIEISLLSDPETIHYDTIEDLRSKIKVGEDGIILQKGSRKATFLPQVWEQLPSFELFFSHLCQKAGMEPHCLESHPEIWRYRVEKVKA
jgi:hypothetical protein